MLTTKLSSCCCYATIIILVCCCCCSYCHAKSVPKAKKQQQKHEKDFEAGFAFVFTAERGELNDFAGFV